MFNLNVLCDFAGMSLRCLLWRAGLLSILSLGAACSQIIPAVEPDPDYAATDPLPPTPALEYQGGAIYQAETAQALFRDGRTYRVGDILTINLAERTDARTLSSTTTAKDDTIGLTVGNLFGVIPTDGDRAIGNTTSAAERSFTGSGNSSQSNRLTGDLTVMVSQVLANGNLMVRGEKIVSINQGTEYIRLSGVVRQSDIAPDNTVSSTRVANARVSYGGGGALADANAAGWLSRFFSSEFWPF